MDSPDQHPAESGSSHSRDDDDIDFTSDYEMSSASSGFTSLEAATKYHVFENGRYGVSLAIPGHLSTLYFVRFKLIFK